MEEWIEGWEQQRGMGGTGRIGGRGTCGQDVNKINTFIKKNKNKRKVGPHTGIKSCHISHTLHTHMYMHIQIQTYAGTHTHLPDREKLFVIAI